LSLTPITELTEIMPQSIDTLRIGHCYEITNYGEKIRFILMEIIDDDHYMIKNLETLDLFNLFDLVRYGKGKDYDLFEIE
jgi:hypothetical protein